MQGLLDKLVFINTTILELPAAMQSAYTSLVDAKANLVRNAVVPGSLQSGACRVMDAHARVTSTTHANSVLGSVWHELCFVLCLQDATMSGTPSPGSVATDLTNFENGLPSLAPLDTLITDLTTAETSLYDATNGFPPATTATLLAGLASFRFVGREL